MRERTKLSSLSLTGPTTTVPQAGAGVQHPSSMPRPPRRQTGIAAPVSVQGSGISSPGNSALVPARAATGSGSVHAIEASRPQMWIKLFHPWM